MDQVKKQEQKSAEESVSVEWLKGLLSLSPKALTDQIGGEFLSLPRKPPISETTLFLNTENKHKNRYYDVPCLDKSRVILKSEQGDYIHANWVEMPEHRSRVILSQAPSMETLSDFYQLLLQEKVVFIVCLTKITERGVQKCYPYWPVQEGAELIYDKYVIKNTGNEDICNSRLSKLELVVNEVALKISHLLYLDWPDHKVPNCAHKFMLLVDLCSKRIGELAPNETFLIHCSAGIGRSGTLTAMLRLMKLIEQKRGTTIVDIVTNLREQRAMAVQGFEQYAFLYRTLIELMYNKLDSKTKEQSGMNITPHVVALRKLTTNSTCNLATGDRPMTKQTMSPLDLRQWQQELSRFNFTSIKQQTLTGAAKLKTGFQELRKKVGKVGFMLVKPTERTISPNSQLAAIIQNPKPFSKFGAKKSHRHAQTPSSSSSPMSNSQELPKDLQKNDTGQGCQKNRTRRSSLSKESSKNDSGK